MIINAPPIGCDVCEKMRGDDSNNWLVLLNGITPSGKHFISIYQWEDERAHMAGAAHACGHNCSSLLMAHWMAFHNLKMK